MRNNLIIMLKWVMNKFSKTIDENTFDVRQYIFKFSKTDDQTIDDESIEEQSEDKEKELSESIESRKRRRAHS